MKKGNFLLIALTICSISIITSCSHDDECHECHIAYPGQNGEVEVEIGEFCGTALEAVEADGYTHTLNEAVIIGSDTVPAGTYGNGNMEIHCEEHADHYDSCSSI